ncbi:TIGR00289 family protein [Candidatus Pacearchaeota archaeon]|nr:TIGR00289 family protein [Candidatus Pacearchaeota archaeon]
MKLGVLFSGGKDSCLAMQKAMQQHEIACLINVISQNEASYMFHVPNIHIAKMQAQAIGLPLVQKTTKGIKEKELDDLKDALIEAKAKFQIEGIVTGAIKSVYQASRIQKLCDELKLQCLNPLWQRDEIGILNELVKNKFKVIISGIFAFPLDKSFLGEMIDAEIIRKLEVLKEKYQINPAGEGGEIETTVLDAPFFKKQIQVLESEISYENNAGIFRIKKAKLVQK